eukprot:scaffold256740_cov34-Tisochrysis_lutea.AAC.2
MGAAPCLSGLPDGSHGRKSPPEWMQRVPSPSGRRSGDEAGARCAVPAIRSRSLASAPASRLMQLPPMRHPAARLVLSNQSWQSSAPRWSTRVGADRLGVSHHDRMHTSPGPHPPATRPRAAASPREALWPTG